MGRMIQIDKFIEELQETQRKFGNTWVYIRDVSWGAVALNREAEDEEVGPGIDLIAEERRRQIKQENYPANWDYSVNGHGELCLAAAAYALNAASAQVEHPKAGEPPVFWPWLPHNWKPKGPMRDLVRAGALIAAEIDRLKRLEEENEEGN